MDYSVLIVIALIVLFFAFRKKVKKQSETTTAPVRGTYVAPKYDHSLRVYLAGCHIAKRKNYILKNGWDSMPVEVEQEPGNKFDKDAIVVKHEGTVIGYIPSDKTHVVKPIITQKEYSAQFDSIDEEESYTNPGSIHLTVYLRIDYND